ncbi:hypothetical protein BC739_004547 [Kutzneria viridogrisea]|uniref:Uncharacterized protein n=1 Tax=Kutzneria viridogrisea TaxID=47990 RepID=A0ABR6BKB8_9PSEU|nr:hypothetical protein [Kutzneria viridogrisea]
MPFETFNVPNGTFLGSARAVTANNNMGVTITG